MKQRKPKLKAKDLIVLETRTWRDKMYGVTYTSGQLSHNGEIVAYFPFEGSVGTTSLEIAAGREIERIFGLANWEGQLWRLRSERKVWVVCVHHEGTKRETQAFGKAYES